MRVQVFQGTDVQQFQMLQTEGKIFSVQPISRDGRNVMTSLRNMGIPLQPIAQVVDDNNNVRGLCFATGNGVALSETGVGYAITYNGQEIMALKQSTQDGIGVAELAAAPTGYAPSLSYPVEQAEQAPYNSSPYGQEPSYYQPQPYQGQQPVAPPPPYQQPYQPQPYQGQQPVTPPSPYQQPPYQGQPYPQQPAYQNGYNPNGFGAPVYPAAVPYVDYHEQQHLLHHYYDDHGWGHHGWGHHGGHYGGHYGGGLGHFIHDVMDHEGHHE